MPQIPEAKFRPTLEQTVIDLLESIALEEISLSHLMNAEAEKVQAFVGKDFNFPMCSHYQEIITFNRSVNQIMDTIVMKEWLLLKKLEHVMRIDVRYRDDCDKGENDDENDNDNGNNSRDTVTEELIDKDHDDHIETESGDWL